HAWQDLHASWQRYLRQANAHGLLRHGEAATQCLDSRQSRRSIQQLIGPAQRRVREAAAALFSSAVRPLQAVPGIVEIPPKQPKVRTNLGSMVDQPLRRHRIATDGRAAGTKD